MLYDLLYNVFSYIINFDVILFVLIMLGVNLLATRWSSLGRRILFVTEFVLVIMVFLPFGQWSATFLENRFPQPTQITADAKGLILLGGSIDMPVSNARKMASYNQAGGRMIQFIELAFQYPHLPILFSGGGHQLVGKETEASFAKDAFERFGVDIKRITLEDKSKNTIENAQFSYEIIKPNPEDKWVLVTSAIHMPRAVALFKKAGWNVIPYPIDYHTRGDYSWSFNLSIYRGFHAWWNSMREWAGLITGYLFGYTNEFLPKPE